LRCTAVLLPGGVAPQPYGRVACSPVGEPHAMGTMADPEELLDALHAIGVIRPVRGGLGRSWQTGNQRLLEPLVAAEWLAGLDPWRKAGVAPVDCRLCPSDPARACESESERDPDCLDRL